MNARTAVFALCCLFTSAAYCEDFGPTAANESLKQIAERMRTDQSFTVEEVMLAVYLANKTAFKNGDINKILADQMLTPPSEEQLLEAAKLDAAKEIKKYSRSSATGKKKSPAELEKELADAKEKDKELEEKNDNLRRHTEELEKELQTLRDRSEELNQKIGK